MVQQTQSKLEFCATSRKCQCTWTCPFVFMARLSKKFRPSSVVWHCCDTFTHTHTLDELVSSDRSVVQQIQTNTWTNVLIKMERPFCVLHNVSMSPFLCLVGRLVTVKHKNHKCGNNRNQPNTHNCTLSFFLSISLYVLFFRYQWRKWIAYLCSYSPFVIHL